MRWLVGVLLTGCFHAGVPLRTARVERSGEVALGVTWTIVGLGDGEAGNTAQRAGFNPFLLFPLPIVLLHNLLLDVRVGLPGEAALGFVVGPQAIGADIRQSVHTDADQAVALEVGGEWVPMDLGFRVRSGARHSAAHAGGWVSGVFATFGTESHAAGCTGWGCRSGIIRHELRLVALAGAEGPVGSGELAGAAVGHAVLWSGPLLGYPNETRPDDTLDERFGGHLVLGGGGRL